MPTIEETLKQVNTNLTRLVDLKTKEQLTQAQAELRKSIQDIETERNNLLGTLNQQRATIADVQGQLEQLKKTNVELLKQIERLRPVTAAPTPVSPLQLASSFKSVVDQIQSEARKTPGVATTIKSMDIEIKGVVQVQPDKTTVLVFPTAEAKLDPGVLSTLRVSFGAIPVVGPEAFGIVPRAGAPQPAPSAIPTDEPLAAAVQPATPIIGAGRRLRKLDETRGAAAKRAATKTKTKRKRPPRRERPT